MFRQIRDHAAAISGLAEALLEVSERIKGVMMALDVYGPVAARLDALERDRQAWEARIESEFLRAEGQFKSARASEERARTLRKHAESLSSTENGADEDAVDALRELFERNATLSQPDEVPDVPPHVAVDPKALARKAKFRGMNG